MARGWHYAKLSLSSALRLYFSGMCILLFLFLSLCRFFFCSHWSLVDVPLIFFCPADHVPDWQPRILLVMVEARSVNVKKTTTTVDDCSPGRGAMAQNRGTRGGTFHGEMDRCRGSQGWTTACNRMPERDGKNQGEDSPKKAGSCWFARPR